MLYGCYPYVVEQLDALVDSSSCIGVKIRQSDWQWRGELHIIGDHGVKSIVLALVSGGTGWERKMLKNVVPLLACLKDRSLLKTVAVEGDRHIGRAVAGMVSPKTPLVVRLLTAKSVFNEVQKQFQMEFSGLDPLSGVEYFHVRILPVVHESFLDRLPLLRQVNMLLRMSTI